MVVSVEGARNVWMHSFALLPIRKIPRALLVIGLVRVEAYNNRTHRKSE